jgi:hypothetical protein
MNIENRKEIILGANMATLGKAEGVRLIYDNDSWAGPIDGVCEWKGVRFYFLCVTDVDAGTVPRRYILIRLTEEQARVEADIHALYVEKVGDFAEYGEDGERKNTIVKSDESQAEFWKAFNNFPAICISGKQVVGWFEL